MNTRRYLSKVFRKVYCNKTKKQELYNQMKNQIEQNKKNKGDCENVIKKIGEPQKAADCINKQLAGEGLLIEKRVYTFYSVLKMVSYICLIAFLCLIGIGIYEKCEYLSFLKSIQGADAYFVAKPVNVFSGKEILLSSGGILLVLLVVRIWVYRKYIK